MLTRVELQSENPFYLKVRDAKPTDSIILHKIEGLNPPPVDNFMGDYARDGGYYNGRRVGPRDVIMTVEINPNYREGETVSGLRTLLHKTFLEPGYNDDRLRIVFKDDVLPDRFLDCYLADFDESIFSAESMVVITLRCPNPFLQNLLPTVISTVGSTITFPFSGTAKTGFTTRVRITQTTGQFFLDLNGALFQVVYPFQANDLIDIDSRPGFRSIQMRRPATSATVTDILYAKAPGTRWLDLRTRDNTYKVVGADGTSAVGQIEQVLFTPMYWGA